MTDAPVSGQELDDLAKYALTLGATAAAVIDSKKIEVRDDLAGLCNGDYPCPKYGLAASCPPHVPGPGAFRKWQAQSRFSIAVKIELPASVMFSKERKRVMKIMHRIVAATEIKSRELGFNRSRAFSSGSCKDLFCIGEDGCRVVDKNQPCRRPDEARPSMSVFGIDVVRLMAVSGWDASKTDPRDASDSNAVSWTAGLVLLA